MTPSDLETYVRQRYNAVGDNFFPQAEIYAHFWNAQMELAIETFCIEASTTTTSTSETRTYAFPTNVYSIRRVEYDGERIYPNDFVDDDAMTGNNPGETITGRPTHYQIWNDTLYLRPTPDTSSLTIRIFSYNLPTNPSVSGTLDVPARYHLYLADYALYSMFSKDKNPHLTAHHLNAWKDHKRSVHSVEALRRRGDEFAVVKDLEDLYLDTTRW